MLHVEEALRNGRSIPLTERRTIMKHKGIRIALAVLEAFVSVGAIAGGIVLLIGAFNFRQGIPLAWLQGTPFSDYTIPALALAILVGGGMLLAAATVFIQREWAVLISVVAGLFMVGFEVVEAASVDSKAGTTLPLMAGLQIFYFVLGLVIFGLATYLWMKEYRSHSFLTSHASHA
jgi:hypothetical protein